MAASENPPGSRPADPTDRSMEQLKNEVEHLRREIVAAAEISRAHREGIRDALDAKFAANTILIDTRFGENAKAITLLQAFADRSPTTAEVQLAVKSLDDLVDVRFDSISTQFGLADKAVSAALAAQEKQNISQQENNSAALAKIETNFTKLTDEIKARTELALKNLTDNLNDIKNTSLLREGRTSISDPSTAAALDKMAYAVNGLGTSRDTATGSKEGFSTIGTIAVGLIALAALVVGVMGLK